MENLPLSEILITARQESTRMRHYYLGVEHLFIALLEVPNGLLKLLLAEEGLAPEYVMNAVRRKVGKGGRQRVHNGFPNTPRTEVILDIAHEIALQNNRQNIHERDLVMAILEEGENIPVYVLRALGVQIEHLLSKAEVRPAARVVTRPFIHIEVGEDVGLLTDEQLYILRKMFNGYARIHVDRRLSGAYDQPALLLVTPMQLDMRGQPSVVVKIDRSAAIVAEAQRYAQHVKRTLPEHNAGVSGRPTAPETATLAGLKYTFETEAEAKTPPRDLKTLLGDWSGARVGAWLQDALYTGYGRMWWQQRKPYRFEAWREYDWLLPPTLTLEAISSQMTQPEIHILKPPVSGGKINGLEYGDFVSVDGFTVQHADANKRMLLMALGESTIGARPYQIEIRGVDFEEAAYYRGEVVERITGRVWKTRAEQMDAFLRLIRPDFDAAVMTIPLGDVPLPNPIRHYNELLDQMVVGSLSTIHGNLHVGSILVGVNDAPLLVDFASTRNGHTLFDWASLEISILNDWLLPLLDPGWMGVRAAAVHLATLNARRALPEGLPKKQAEVFAALRALREVVAQCLAKPGAWGEYYISLALLSLRVLTQDTLPMDQRRLMLYVSALAMHTYGLRQEQVAAPKPNLSTEVDLTEIKAQLQTDPNPMDLDQDS